MESTMSEHSASDDDSTNVGLEAPLLGRADEDSHQEFLSIDDAIERLGLGWFQLVILVTAGLCFAADAMQIILVSFLAVVLKAEWDLSDAESASIASFLFFGALGGCLVLGNLADSIGRRPVFILSGLDIVFFGMATSLVSSYWQLTGVFCMIGFGVGGLVVPYDILAEFLPSQTRGSVLMAINYFWTLGSLFVVVLAYLTLRESPNWRLFVFLCSLPCLLSIVLGYWFVPESPRWLCAQGRSDEALQILRKAATMNNHDVDTAFPSEIQLVAEEEVHSTVWDLLHPKWRRTTLHLWGTWLTSALGYYGTILALTRIFASDDESKPERSFSFDYSAIFVSCSAELAGLTLAILCVQRLGRIPCQVGSYALAGISVSLLCAASSAGGPRLLLISLGFLARIFEMGGTCTTWVSTAEILTTEIRASGHSAASAVAKVGSCFSPFLIGGGGSMLRVGVGMLVVHSFTVACVSQLPETKGGHLGSTGLGPDSDPGAELGADPEAEPDADPLLGGGDSFPSSSEEMQR